MFTVFEIIKIEDGKTLVWAREAFADEGKARERASKLKEAYVCKNIAWYIDGQDQ